MKQTQVECASMQIENFWKKYKMNEFSKKIVESYTDILSPPFPELNDRQRLIVSASLELTKMIVSYCPEGKELAQSLSSLSHACTLAVKAISLEQPNAD